MALFTGKADQNLPLWTQLLQIDVPENWREDPESLLTSELARWWEEEEGYTQRGRPVPAYMEDIVGIVRPTPAEEIRVLTHLAQMQEWGAAVLGSFADDKEIPRADGIVCANELSTVQRRLGIAYPGKSGIVNPADEPDGPPIPIEQMINIELTAEKVSNTEGRLLLEMWSAFDRKVKAGRCDECGFPFLAQGRIARFCSHRCGDRNATRRRRAKKRKNLVLSY